MASLSMYLPPPKKYCAIYFLYSSGNDVLLLRDLSFKINKCDYLARLIAVLLPKYPILLTHIGFDNTLSVILFQSPLHASLQHSVHCDRQNQVPHVSGPSLLLLVFSHLQSHEIEIVNKIVKICCDHCHCQCSPLVLEAKIILSVKVTPLCQYVTNVIILGGEQRGRRAERSIAISLLEEPEEEAFRVWLWCTAGPPPPLDGRMGYASDHPLLESQWIK